MVFIHVAAPYLINKALERVERNAERPNAPSELRKIATVVPALRNLVAIVHRCHLALFYLRGVFYHVAKRLTGIHYVSCCFYRFVKLLRWKLSVKPSSFNTAWNTVLPRSVFNDTWMIVWRRLFSVASMLAWVTWFFLNIASFSDQVLRICQYWTCSSVFVCLLDTEPCLSKCTKQWCAAAKRIQ